MPTIRELIATFLFLSKKSCSTGMFFCTAVLNAYLWPLVLVLSFWGHMIEYFWGMVEAFWRGAFKVLNTTMVTTKVYFRSVECYLMYWCEIESNKEIDVKVRKKIYKPLETMLKDIHVLPLFEEEAYTVYAILEKFDGVLFGEGRISLPHFLFKGVKLQKNTANNYKKSENSSEKSKAELEHEKDQQKEHEHEKDQQKEHEHGIEQQKKPEHGTEQQKEHEHEKDQQKEPEHGKEQQKERETQSQII